jgi:hypothetical protein
VGVVRELPGGDAVTEPARTLTDAELDDLAERLAKRLEGRLAPAANEAPRRRRVHRPARVASPEAVEKAARRMRRYER